MVRLGLVGGYGARRGYLTSRKILAYHPGRQGVEKRLGRHLVALLEASLNPEGVAARRIAEIYDELHLTVEEANPGRTQDRFERALAPTPPAMSDT